MSSSESNPDFQTFTAALKQLGEEIRAKPREDMLTSRPPMVDEKCEYRYR